MMNRTFFILVVITFLSAACSSPQTTTEEPTAASAGEGEAAQEPAASSNRGTAEIVLGSTQASINYGRPELKGRNMLSQLPDGQVWRLGMNDATRFETNSDLLFGQTLIQAGRYSIWAKKVSSDDWRLIFNSEADISGLERKAGNDIAETPLESSELPESVEKF
ncbi:MAG: DUF2911 domain-containing protein, partial [Acidobacteria bacterium]|nr:DUF2911 domain-containing protein [Acidobacteriota bacterium]